MHTKRSVLSNEYYKVFYSHVLCIELGEEGAVAKVSSLRCIYGSNQ